MKILLLLIMISLVLAILFVGLFIWSIRSGQYDDTDSPSVRMLMDNQIKKDKKSL